jgi:hypothetical protein
VEVETRVPRAFATTGAHLTAAAACAIDIDIVCFAVPERHSRARATAIGDPGLFCSRDDDEVYLIQTGTIFSRVRCADWANRQQSI